LFSNDQIETETGGYAKGVAVVEGFRGFLDETGGVLKTAGLKAADQPRAD